MEINDLNLKATEAFNFLSDTDLEEKIKMSKIRLFCKSYEVLFNEETKTFKIYKFLKPNEKRYLSEFINSEIARLEEISKGMITGTFTMRKRVSSNMEKFKHFVDEIDQIKRLSYSSIKKEDFSFEHNGKISKYWTLNRNMVPEGHDDSLKALDCTFRNSQSKTITLGFNVHTDLSNGWMVEVSSSETFFSTESFSMCAVERYCSSTAVPSVYFPKVLKNDSEENKKAWSMDMRHLTYPEKEVTFIFSFSGTVDKSFDSEFENLKGSVLKTIVEEDLDLIEQINEFPFAVSTNASVSMSLVVCNFLKNIIVVKDPHLTSGTLDSGHPWPKNIKPSSTDLLYTRKKSIEARGSVGLTVISVQDRFRLYSFVVHWQAPFDFNLYKNSFVVFPLPGQHYSSSQEVTKLFKSFIDYSNIHKSDENFVGIRGFAKDGPKAMEFCGMLISIKMGVQHNDCLQLSILPLGQAKEVENK